MTIRRSGARSAVVASLLVGALIVLVAGGGFAAWKRISADEGPGTSTSTPSSEGAPAQALPATDPKLAKFYHQELAWRDCGGGDCATLDVPLDYADPTGRTIRLAVLKLPARDESARLGSIVVNPGGPGGSGIQYAAGAAFGQFGQLLPTYYDIVGFDPRGVGQSDPVRCLRTGQLDRLVASDPDPDTRAERTEMDRLVHNFGEGCLTRSGDLARHISTPEAARDMDILRAALGEARLDYLGASYGTFLGATYADLFPKHVGKMVLDGAIDPALSTEQLSLAQAHGFEVALRAFVKSCVDTGSCILGDSVDAGTTRVRTLLDQIEASPLPTDDSDRPLTAGLAMIGTWMPLYVKNYWPRLEAALTQAIDDHRGSALLALADVYLSRSGSGYQDNSMEALYAINCLDHDDYVKTEDVPKHFAAFLAASPTYGKAFAFGLSTCSSWPVRSGHRTTALHARGAAPIIVIGTTRDPATPLVWAQALARQLDSGQLITRDGDGHTAFQRGNACVDDAVQDYFVKGVLPRPDLKC